MFNIFDNTNKAKCTCIYIYWFTYVMNQNLFPSFNSILIHLSPITAHVGPTHSRLRLNTTCNVFQTACHYQYIRIATKCSAFPVFSIHWYINIFFHKGRHKRLVPKYTHRVHRGINLRSL